MPQLKLFLLALSFYTRIPVPAIQDYSQLPKANSYLPVIGWLVGGLSGLCFYIADNRLPQSTAIILSLVFTILLTGAFHEDGFADVCDGFGGGYGKERILAIMKDSQIGAYGAIGLILLLALKISLLISLPAQQLPFILVAAHSLSRLQPLLIMASYDYARSENSKSAKVMYRPGLQELLFPTATALLPLLLLPALCSLVIPLVIFVNWRLGRYFFRHIGGYTGDCLGTSQQVAETVFYLSISAAWTYI